MNNIIIGKNLLEKLDKLIDVNQFSKIAILTDENVASHWLTVVKKSLNNPVVIVIKSGEKEKNIETVKKIWEKMFELGLDRKSLLINLGGGVVCDIGGFSASTFMRGIEFNNIPTTLLAQVDASIGGKVGIDFNEIKNGVGLFKEPSKIIIDVKTLETLPKRELVSAFGEIIKHGVISGREYFDLVISKKPEEFGEEELIEIIKKSIKIKLNIVKKDPNEINVRKILNFGHTIGHAIESLSWKTDNSLLHGEAVALGMIAESNLISSQPACRQAGLCGSIEKAVAHAGLPIRIKNVSVKDILQVMSLDKKNIGKKILWSLPENIGKINISVEVPNDLIIKAIKSIII